MPDDGVAPDEIPQGSLKPILNDAEGCYQIGPADLCTESFVLSVTIAYAANLAQVSNDMYLNSNIELTSGPYFHVTAYRGILRLVVRA